MSAQQGRARRLVSYALIGAAFLVVVAFAGAQTLRLQAEQADEALEGHRGELAALLRLWESSVLERASSSLSSLIQEADPSRTEANSRKTLAWFDAYYRWDMEEGGRLLYPPPDVAKGAAARPDSPCLAEAAVRAQDAPLPLAAEAWLSCLGEPPAARIEAANRAAALNLAAGRPRVAWDTLVGIEPQLYTPLASPVLSQVPLRLVLARRLLAAEALGGFGDSRRQTTLLDRTGEEINDLPLSALPEGLSWVEAPILSTLSATGADEEAEEVRRGLRRARRLLEGHQEVSARLAPLAELALADTPSALAPEGGLAPGALRQAYDLYRRHGFVILYGAIPGTREVAALQLDQDALLDGLLSSVPDSTFAGSRLVVLDADGTPLRGAVACVARAQPGRDPLWVQIPFGHLLSHLRLGLCAPDGVVASGRTITGTLSQLAPVVVALLLGGGALVSRVGSDRRQQELFDRQRAFITRVTHELKTPLAGIRVMAETLELGAFKDAAQREHFAARIVSEVDRLGARIDEVLSVVRRDAPPKREPIEPSALAAGVAEPWLPRFEAVGGRLALDLRPCAPLLTDPALLADALNNLLDNALKYRREDRPALVRMSARAEGRWVIFEVVDNGLGVPAAQRRMIFEPFARVEGPGRGKAGGHGLGLSFVAETARLLGGAIDCREGLEGGARFVLRLRRRTWTPAGWRAWWSSRTTTPSPSDS